AVGGGLYVESLAATVIILAILSGIKPLEEKFQQRRRGFEIRVRARRGELTLDELNKMLGYRARRITRFVCVPADGEGIDEITVTFTRISATDLAEMEQQLKASSPVLET